MKRFIIGFIVGIGIMYWYLRNGEAVEMQARRWFEGSASRYRDDKQHEAAREILGGSEQH